MSYVDDDGISRRQGLPDFANSIEIKSVLTSRNATTAIENHSNSAAVKRGVGRLIIDTNDAKYLHDADIREAMETLLPRYDFLHVSILMQDGRLLDIA